MRSWSFFENVVLNEAIWCTIFHYVKHLTAHLLGCLLLKNRMVKKVEGPCPPIRKVEGPLIPQFHYLYFRPLNAFPALHLLGWRHLFLVFFVHAYVQQRTWATPLPGCETTLFWNLVEIEKLQTWACFHTCNPSLALFWQNVTFMFS